MNFVPRPPGGVPGPAFIKLSKQKLNKFNNTRIRSLKSLYPNNPLSLPPLSQTLALVSLQRTFMQSFIAIGFLEVRDKFVLVVVGSAQVRLGNNKNKHN